LRRRFRSWVTVPVVRIPCLIVLEERAEPKMTKKSDGRKAEELARRLGEMSKELDAKSREVDRLLETARRLLKEYRKLRENQD
jgi:hypothetical protein